MSITNKIGSLGERIAAEYLIKNGYIIIEKNYRCKFGEIDIIACNEKEIVCVEVKTRSNDKYGKGTDAIDKEKQRHVYKTAQYYLYEKGEKKTNIRIDAIDVKFEHEGVKINHYMDIIKEKP